MHTKLQILKQLLLNKIRNPKFRFLIFKFKRLPYFFQKNNSQSNLLREINKEGFSKVKNLFSEDTITELLTYAKKSKLIDPWTKQEFININYVSGVNVAHVLHTSDLNLKINSIALLEIKSVLNCYFRGKYFIDAVDMWWSLPTSDRQEAEFFHRDGEALRILKIFVYVTDVDLFSAPNYYVAGSHTKNLLTEVRRYSDEEVMKFYPRIDVTTGESGTTFIADTYGIHRGDLARTPRLLFQIRVTDSKSLYFSNNNFSKIFREILA
ncbi:hypothetical protein G6659_01695 [Polynucleobacter paneuropaeus]|nr:hypothetical protein G6659_01695 [Polynucleobacter paneuropaeus]